MKFFVSRVANGRWNWTLQSASGAVLAQASKPLFSVAAAVQDIQQLQVVGTLLAGVMIQAPQTNTPPVAVPPTTALLSQADFTPLGYYDLDASLSVSWNVIYAQGLTCRRVDGELRFLSLFYPDTGKPLALIEYALPSVMGRAVKQTNRWNDVFAGGPIPNQNDCWYGLSWDQPKQRLWTSFGIDYPDAQWEGSTLSLQTRTLNNDGTISDLRGPWGLSGISHRRTCGAVLAVPADFQTQYGVGSYAVQGGGYASRMVAGGKVSMGPTLYAFVEPSTPGNVPCTTLLDHSDATDKPAWYPASSDRSTIVWDRGVRNPNVQTEYDDWTSPAPDGLGRWTWSDNAWQTGCWIQGPRKRGVLLFPSFATGKARYLDSTLHCDGRSYEIQIYDPAALGEVAQGKRPPWSVKPAARWEVPLEGFGAGTGGNAPAGNVAATTFDEETSTLYALCPQVNGLSQGAGKSRLFAWHVDV